MKAEDVNPEWVEAAFKAAREGSDALAPGWMQRALAAAAPLIAAAEREKAAALLDTMVVDLNTGRLMPAPTRYPDTVRGAFAAAIRALGDEG